MNYTIKPFTFTTNKQIQQSIRALTKQLLHQNYAVINNPRAIQLFSRTIPQYYKKQNIVIFTSKNGQNIITINPKYKFTKNNNKTFKIRLK